MSFNLEVEFVGLCNYLVQQDQTAVGMVMPDARLPLDGLPVDPDDNPPCKDHLVYHVGYLRYNLADAGPGGRPEVPSDGRAGTPSFEVIHRFDYDEIDFGFESCESE